MVLLLVLAGLAWQLPILANGKMAAGATTWLPGYRDLHRQRANLWQFAFDLKNLARPKSLISGRVGDLDCAAFNRTQATRSNLLISHVEN